MHHNKPKFFPILNQNGKGLLIFYHPSVNHCIPVCVFLTRMCFFLPPRFPEELGAAFFPGMPEGWAAHPLHTAYTELSPAALHHPTLIQHPALAQVSWKLPFIRFWKLLYENCIVILACFEEGNTETEMPFWCRICHWLLWKFSKWQLFSAAADKNCMKMITLPFQGLP